MNDRVWTPPSPPMRGGVFPKGELGHVFRGRQTPGGKAKVTECTVFGEVAGWGRWNSISKGREVGLDEWVSGEAGSSTNWLEKYLKLGAAPN